MPLTLPVFNQYNKFISSKSDMTAWMINPVAAGNNALTGTPTTLITSGNFTDDAYGMMVTLNGSHLSATTKSYGVSIYHDGVLLIDRLIASGPSMHQFWFPLYLKSGVAITADAAANSASQNIGVHIVLYCRPSRPDTLWCGEKVVSLGKHGTNLYTGTVVASGASGAKGNWVAMGTLASDVAPRYWEYGIGHGGTDATYGDMAFMTDMAEGTSTTVNDIIFQDLIEGVEGSELTMRGCTGFAGFHDTKAGQTIYFRSAKGTSTTTNDAEMIAYGVY